MLCLLGCALCLVCMSGGLRSRVAARIRSARSSSQAVDGS